MCESNRFCRSCGFRSPSLKAIITTRHVSFEVALFMTAVDQRGKNTRDYHNPTRQRGIYGNTFKTLQLNPSLTFRVVIAPNAASKTVNSGMISSDAGLAGVVADDCELGRARFPPSHCTAETHGSAGASPSRNCTSLRSNEIRDCTRTGSMM